MKTLISLGWLLTTMVSGQLFSMDDNSLYQDSEVNPNKNLPLYNLSQTEINSLPDGPEKEEAQELYNFMKLSYNVISNKKEELNKVFFSPHADISLIYFCKQMLNNPDNYKHLGEDYKQYFDSAINILHSNKHEYNQYTKDIIRNNLYSISFDTLIDKYQLDANSFRYMTRDYIMDTLIPRVCNEVQDKYRKEIVNSLLNNYLLHKMPENISSDDYEKHLIRMNGIHRDKYDNYSNHITFFGLSFNTFMQIINSLDNSNMNSQLQNFKFLVLEGYITNPYIVKYMKSK